MPTVQNDIPAQNKTKQNKNKPTRTRQSQTSNKKKQTSTTQKNKIESVGYSTNNGVDLNIPQNSI